MTIEEILQMEDTGKAIAALQNHRHIDQPDTKVAEKALDPKMHDVNDKMKRRDKRVKMDTELTLDEHTITVMGDGEKSSYRTEPVVRTAVAIQRLIIKRAVSFLFGNAVKYNATTENDTEKAVMKAFNRILHDAKETTLNRKAARSIFSYKECAEYWYAVEKGETHSDYGFDTRFKMRSVLWSPERGDTLYPYFDERGDMVAFSRQFTTDDGTGTARITYFETFTATMHYLWRLGQAGWEMAEGFPKKNQINKIPVVFGHQDDYETADVDQLVYRLESLLSNFGDTNDYHASPKIFVTGQIDGWAKKGESGAVIQGEEGSTMQYVSWQSAPEAVKLEIETLLKLIYTLTQTPDISWDSVKGLNVSGVALKLLFMDAHLKVQDKREIFDEYLQRRTNIIKEFIGMMNVRMKKDCNALEITPEITPYIITSEKDDIEYWMAANGNKPVISQRESVTLAGLTDDPDATMRMIEEESDGEAAFTIGEPTGE